MRKIILTMCVMVFILGFSVADAKISRTEDSFEGTSKIESNIDDFSFRKLFEKDGTILYRMEIDLVESEWWFFANQAVEFKFDNDDTIYPLKTVNSASSMLGASSLSTQIVTEVPQDVIDKISNSKTITMRINYSNHNPVTIIMPSKMESEWKKIIDSGKDGKPLS